MSSVQQWLPFLSSELRTYGSDHVTLLPGFTLGITVQNRTLHSHPPYVTQYSLCSGFPLKYLALTVSENRKLNVKLESSSSSFPTTSHSPKSVESSPKVSPQSVSPVCVPASLVRAFITSRWQYSNSLLACTPLTHSCPPPSSLPVARVVFMKRVGFVLHSDLNLRLRPWPVSFRSCRPQADLRSQTQIYLSHP